MNDTRNLAERLVRVMKSQVGVHELSHANDGLPSTRYMGGRKEPWCAHLICWAFREAGAPLPGYIEPSPKRANPLASVAEMERVFRGHDWIVQEPRVGAILFFAERGKSDKGHGRHVGVVTDVGEDRVEMISGNWGDSVAYARFNRAELAKLVTSIGFRPDSDVD